MKIFNNFDTELKEHDYQEKVKIYGEKNVLLIQRDFFYWILKGLIPLILYIVISTVFAFVMCYFEETLGIFFYVIFGLWGLFSIVFLYDKFNIYIDYKMDFSIITKDEILTYKQQGILNSRYKNFPILQLKSVYSARTGILGNIFQFGEIIFLTEGTLTTPGLSQHEEEGSGSGKIVMTYVKKPNKVRQKVTKICFDKMI